MRELINKELSLEETKKGKKNRGEIIMQKVKIAEKIHDTIINFIDELKNERMKIDTDFDNEFGSQFEMGVQLKEQLKQDKYKVFFEKNVRTVVEDAEEFIKKEMDLFITDTEKKNRYAIELKFPRNGQYPETMFSFVKDIKFLEQLCKKGNFDKCWAVVLVDDDKFYKETGREKEDSIYSYFRSQKVLVGTIVKPTGDNKSKFIELTNQYTIQWKQIKNNLYYYIIEVENK